jgi:Family of unknown function (DUF5678)
MQLIDWTTLYENYKGLWVALSDADNETVVGSGETAKEALDQAHRNGFANAALTFVPTEMITFAGTVYESSRTQGCPIRSSGRSFVLQ